MDKLVKKLVCFFKKCYNYCITKLFWLKHKRVIAIVCATLFLVALFSFKNGIPFRGKTALQSANEEKGLIYGDATVATLIENDTDEDGVLDWEEALWGLDPLNSETNPGTPDGTAVAKLKATYEPEDSGFLSEANLTETDKFSRELLSTLVTLNQTGEVDNETIEKITTSLSEHIKDYTPDKIFTLSELNISEDNSVVATKRYNETLEKIHSKYPVTGTGTEILQKFISEETGDASALKELDIMISNTENIISELLKTPVPGSLAIQHLSFVNSLERLVENFKNIQQYETDAIVALGAISQYETSLNQLSRSVLELKSAIETRLAN